MTFKNKIKYKFTAASRGGTSKECGPGNHRHPDAWQNKCHPVSQRHSRHQLGPNKQGIGQATKLIKKLKVV